MFVPDFQKCGPFIRRPEVRVGMSQNSANKSDHAGDSMVIVWRAGWLTGSPWMCSQEGIEDIKAQRKPWVKLMLDGLLLLQFLSDASAEVRDSLILFLDLASCAAAKCPGRAVRHVVSVNVAEGKPDRLTDGRYLIPERCTWLQQLQHLEVNTRQTDAVSRLCSSIHP
jgi:hypothetical protein